MQKTPENLDVNVGKDTSSKRKIWDKKYYLLNQKEICRKQRIYKSNNREKINKQRKLRRQKDLEYKLLIDCRKRLGKAIQGIDKSKPTLELLGCSVEFLKQHLEKQFQPGMSWDKRHLIHIDHIRPCSSFDLTIPEEQAKCFHYTNLQPLWAKDNLSKGAKYDG